MADRTTPITMVLPHLDLVEQICEHLSIKEKVRFTCSTKALLRLTEPSAALWASANVEWQSRDQLPAVARWLARKRGVVRRLTLSSTKADGQLDSPAACGFMLGCLAGAPLESLSLGCALDLSSTLLLDLPGLQRLEVEPRGGPSHVNLSDGLAHLTSLTRLHLGDLGTCSSLDECTLPAALRALSMDGMYGPEGLAAVEAVAPQLHELHLSWDGVSEGADTGAAGFLARASTRLTALTGLSLNYARLRQLPRELAALGGTLRALDLIDNPRLVDAHSVLADLARLTWLSLRGCGFAAVPAGVWRLQELQVLDVSNNQLQELLPPVPGSAEGAAQGSAPAPQRPLPPLRRLAIGGVAAAAVADCLGRFSQLSTLYLRYPPVQHSLFNQATDASLKLADAIAALPALRLLVLADLGTGVPLGLGLGLVRLGRRRPQLRVAGANNLLPRLAQLGWDSE